MSMYVFHKVWIRIILAYIFLNLFDLFFSFVCRIQDDQEMCIFECILSTGCNPPLRVPSFANTDQQQQIHFSLQIRNRLTLTNIHS